MAGYYYTYPTTYQSAASPYPAGYWEDPADWPRSFVYVPNQGGLQGIHPPAPVYQSNQSAQSAMAYYQVRSQAQLFNAASLTPQFRVVRVSQLGTTPMATTTEQAHLLPQPVGPTPPLATLAIPFLPLLLNPLHRTTRTRTHNMVQPQ